MCSRRILRRDSGFKNHGWMTDWLYVRMFLQDYTILKTYSLCFFDHVVELSDPITLYKNVHTHNIKHWYKVRRNHCEKNGKKDFFTQFLFEFIKINFFSSALHLIHSFFLFRYLLFRMFNLKMFQHLFLCGYVKLWRRKNVAEMLSILLKVRFFIILSRSYGYAVF